MKKSIKGMLCIVAVLPIVRLRADSITLKSGEIVSGMIESVTNGSVRIRAAMRSGAITYVRSFPTNQISIIDKVPDDEVDFEKLSRYSSLNSMSFPKDYYESIITNVFLPFVKKYPNSTRTPVVNLMIDAWRSELQKVASGGCKVDGKWYFGTEAEEARTKLCLFRIKQLIDTGDAAIKKRDLFSAASFYFQMLDVQPQCMATLAVIEKRMELVLGALKERLSNAPQDPREVARARSEEEKAAATAAAARWTRENQSFCQFYDHGQPVFPGKSATFSYNVWKATSDGVNQYKNALSAQAQNQFFYDNLNNNYRTRLGEIKKMIEEKRKTFTGKKTDEIWVP